MIGIDTTVLVDLDTGDDAAGMALARLAGENYDIALSAVSLEEFLVGIPPDFMEQTKQAIVNANRILLLDEEGALQAALIEMDRMRAGTKISRTDALIAGTMLRHGVGRILTRDAKGFADIAGLEVISY